VATRRRRGGDARPVAESGAMRVARGNGGGAAAASGGRLALVVEAEPKNQVRV
jgi:hypothetical protein